MSDQLTEHNPHCSCLHASVFDNLYNVQKSSLEQVVHFNFCHTVAEVCHSICDVVTAVSRTASSFRCASIMVPLALWRIRLLLCYMPHACSWLNVQQSEGMYARVHACLELQKRGTNFCINWCFCKQKHCQCFWQMNHKCLLFRPQCMRVWALYLCCFHNAKCMSKLLLFNNFDCYECTHSTE